VKYTQSHEWILLDSKEACIGITNYAQKELGSIVYVELPSVGHALQAGDEVVVLESTKAAVDIYTPVSGTITAVNTTLQSHPEYVNEAPEKEGWLYKMSLSNPQELDAFMDKSAYTSRASSH
jgi:glycine cleavage system H protein